MLAARRLDGEDPKVVLYLRCAYAAVQCVAVIVILFVYYKASLAAKDKANAVKIYVPPPPQVCVHNMLFEHAVRSFHYVCVLNYN
jgi:hypothetical protein